MNYELLSMRTQKRMIAESAQKRKHQIDKFITLLGFCASSIPFFVEIIHRRSIWVMQTIENNKPSPFQQSISNYRAAKCLLFFIWFMLHAMPNEAPFNQKIDQKCLEVWRRENWKVFLHRVEIAFMSESSRLQLHRGSFFAVHTSLFNIFSSLDFWVVLMLFLESSSSVWAYRLCARLIIWYSSGFMRPTRAIFG